MKLINTLCSLLIIMSLTSCSQTQLHREPANTDYTPKEAIFKLRAETLLYELNEEFQIEGLKISIDEEIAANDNKLSVYLETLAKNYFEGDHKAQKRIKEVNWKELAAFIKDKSKESLDKVKLMARTNGVDVGIVYVTAVLIGDIVPIVLAAIGEPALAAAFVVIPTGTSGTGAYIALKRLFRLKHTIKEYGGYKSYRYYKSLEKSAKKNLNLKKDSDLIIDTENSNEKIVIPDDGIVRKVLSLVHPKEKRLSYRTLKKMAQARGMSDVEYKNMKKEIQDRTLRAVLLYKWIENKLSIDEIDELKSRYPANFIQAAKSQDLTHLTQWAMGILSVQNCHDLNHFLKNIPGDASVTQVATLWDELMIPVIAENFKKGSPFKFYQMVKDASDLRIQARINAKELWDQNWQNQLISTTNSLCETDNLK